jgi:hypothetical protein
LIHCRKKIQDDIRHARNDSTKKGEPMKCVFCLVTTDDSPELEMIWNTRGVALCEICITLLADNLNDINELKEHRRQEHG